jgi:hypothetical protein
MKLDSLETLLVEELRLQRRAADIESTSQAG